MKYEIEFDKESVEEFFITLFEAFEESEQSYMNGDLLRNITNVTTFENTVRTLRLFGADVDCGAYNSNGFMRMGYARINGYVFIKNNVADYLKLSCALCEIAHLDPCAQFNTEES